MYLYGALDWSAFTAAGEPASIVKMKGCTAYGLALVGSAVLAVGDTLVLDGTAGGKFRQGSTFAPLIPLSCWKPFTLRSRPSQRGKVHIRQPTNPGPK
ncbi:MAG: hypothetical protein MZV70_29105 [Desulfobacterales bacterium]|nr:hypothetical protein [Desulfobacterales bacterium]